MVHGDELADADLDAIEGRLKQGVRGGLAAMEGVAGDARRDGWLQLRPFGGDPGEDNENVR
jgi:hypothetical protein